MRWISILHLAVCGTVLALAPGESKGQETKSLAIPAAAANGVSENADNEYFEEFGRYIPGDDCHTAPVYLPHGGNDVTV